MEVKFFKSGFQFEQYISNRMLEIGDEGERRIFKEFMQETLIPFYEHTEAAYMEIEKRLMHTQSINSGKFEIITGVQKRERIDLTETAMVPMDMEDLKNVIVDTIHMKEKLAEGVPYTVMKIFIRDGYNAIRMLEHDNRVFNGIIYTEDDEYKACFHLKKNNSYIQQIASLYKIFVSNGLEWNTVCAPYLSKFFDVQVIGTECPIESDIKKIIVDFDEYRNYVVYDMVPMWNVCVREENSGGYPDFSIDQIHYEHLIYNNRLADDRDYLVYNDKVRIWEVFRYEGDMHIICDEDQPIHWKLTEIGYDAFKKNYDFPVFGNCGVYKNTRRCIHTYSEVMKYVSELGYEAWLKLLDIKKVQDSSAAVHAMYSMDEFMEDEIRISKLRPQMLFIFEPKDKDNYLNQDIMSFLVSKLQWILPEFECIGQLI